MRTNCSAPTRWAQGLRGCSKLTVCLSTRLKHLGVRKLPQQGGHHARALLTLVDEEEQRTEVGVGELEGVGLLQRAHRLGHLCDRRPDTGHLGLLLSPLT